MIVTHKTPGAERLLVWRHGQLLGRIVRIDTGRQECDQAFADGSGQVVTLDYTALAWSHDSGDHVAIASDEQLGELLASAATATGTPLEAAIELAFWRFDARRKEDGAERLAFKNVTRALMETAARQQLGQAVAILVKHGARDGKELAVPALSLVVDSVEAAASAAADTVILLQPLKKKQLRLLKECLANSENPTFVDATGG